MRLLLPAPVRPTMPTFSPARMWKLRPCSTGLRSLLQCLRRCATLRLRTLELCGALTNDAVLDNGITAKLTSSATISACCGQ
eukprot:47174-Eustigmatos_ZCMA.PRE.1